MLNFLRDKVLRMYNVSTTENILRLCGSHMTKSAFAKNNLGWCYISNNDFWRYASLLNR